MSIRVIKDRPVDGSMLARFMDKVSPEPTSGCWLWSANIDRKGYGIFTVGYVQHGAHRAAYELHVGAIPEGLFVCHSCDVRSCVNPGHLWLGTNADNTADMKRKGRAAKGTMKPNARLTEDAVRQIRVIVSAGVESHASIARAFDVDPSCISRIAAGISWAHVQ